MINMIGVEREVIIKKVDCNYILMLIGYHEFHEFKQYFRTFESALDHAKLLCEKLDASYSGQSERV